jgi:hypothetical protein
LVLYYLYWKRHHIAIGTDFRGKKQKQQLLLSLMEPLLGQVLQCPGIYETVLEPVPKQGTVDKNSERKKPKERRNYSEH